MGSLINDYSEGIWTVKADRITGSFQQGLWEIKPQDIQYFAETYVTDQAGRMGLQLLIKTNNIAQPYPIGVYFETNPKMTEVIGDFAASFGISYQKAVQQAPVYQQQYQQPQPQPQQQPQQPQPQQQPQTNAQINTQAYQQPNQQPYKRKKSSVGKVIGFSFLILIIAMIAYAVFWFMGIKSIADDFAMPSNPDDAVMESMYDDIMAKAASGEATEIVLNEEESKYFISKLNNETSFFKFDDGNNVKIERMIMYPEGGKVRVELVIDIKSGLPIIGASNSQMSFYAAAVPQSVYGSMLGVSAVMEVRDTPESMAFKPISVTVGNSPMPVGVAMGLVRQFVPGIDITDDGFINFEPMEVFGENGDKLFDITGFEIRDGNLVIYTE